ncbi:FkbM family methyltransferase [Solitalea longa]|uniref:FkbM family methyltransferase n=1 Tax=Solitalea longa TaxID=2079460 RepID=A0A2S5A9R3_9SPHI|nr:FkbM family methyltransferase [Solitalea longa]POY39112.1 FkbM family methyltransferase [Solitalea longa]
MRLINVVKGIQYLIKGTEISLYQKVKLKLAPRYKKINIQFSKKPIEVTDGASFIACYQEIFIDKIYEFKAHSSNPFIIDCGANVGLSILYFKKIYPEARIIAFEPDPNIYQVMKNNIDAFGCQNVDARQEAIWNEHSTIYFESDGGTSGHIGEQRNGTVPIKSFRLKDLLQDQKVDLLKIDIEGAEYEVLVDCKDVLQNADKLFVEYHSREKSSQHLDEILTIISKAGFRYHIQDAYTSPQPFVHIKPMLDMDNQLNIFCYKN